MNKSVQTVVCIGMKWTGPFDTVDLIRLPSSAAREACAKLGLRQNGEEPFRLMVFLFLNHTCLSPAQIIG